MKSHQAQVSFQKNRNLRNLLFTPWLGLTLALPVQAAGWVMNVTTTTDETSGPGTGCSLREAIQNFEDNALTYPECGGTVSSPVTINVPAGTYPLSGGYIGIGRTDSLTIQGAGASDTTLDRATAPGVRGFQVGGGINLTLNDLTLTNGLDTGAGGGAIYSTSTGLMTVNNCIFSNNQTTGSTTSGGAIYLNGGSLLVTGSSFTNNTSSNGGGAIFVNSGNVTISGSIFTGNQATAHAGALLISSGATATINTSTFTGNQATAHAGALLISSGATATINTSTFVNNCASCGGGGDGGAILNVGTLTLNDSTFTNNHTTVSTNGENGGALTARGAASTTTINRSTFSGNTATHGGAIFISNSGSFSLSNSTLTGNNAGNASTAGVSTGGAISLYSGVTTATLKNVTVAGNSVNGSKGGGLYSDGTTTLNLYNSLFANNTGGVNSDCDLFSGSLAVDTNNLVMSGNCGTPAVTTDPSLATLANNGGSTQTMALSLGSSALEVGDDASCLSPSQNGLTRPQGTHCDIGAYEMIGYTFSTAIAGTGTGNVTGSTLAGNYSSGTLMTLVAAATGGAAFIGWTPSPSCTTGFALTANTVCTATFDKTNQVISFTPPTSATVGDAPLTLNATGGGSGNPVTLASTTPSVCTVSGTTLTILSAGTCTVTADQAGNASYNAATPVPGNITINPVAVIVPPTVTPPPPTVTPPPPTSPPVEIPPPLPAPRTLHITLAGTGQGGVTSDPTGIDCSPSTSTCSYTVLGPQWVYPTITPATGSEFTGWTGDLACTKDGGDKVLMLQDTSCTATFDLKFYTLTVERNIPGATVTGDGMNCQDTPQGFLNLEGLGNLLGNSEGSENPGCQATYPYGTTVTLEASDAPLEWEFVGWGGSCESQGQVTMTRETVCRAKYREDPTIPNGMDGNGDGQNDAHQPNVMSLADKMAGGYITLEVKPDCVVADGATVTAEMLGGSDPNHPTPQGLMAFELQCSQTPVTMYFHGFHQLLRNLEFLKYGPKIPGDPKTVGWYTLPNVTFKLVTVGGQPVVAATYILTDGQFGDNTGVDGRIVDPGGLGLQ